MKPKTSRLVVSMLPLASTVVIAYAFGGESGNLPPPPPPPAVPATDAGLPVATTTPTSTSAPKPPAPPVTLTPGAASPDPTAPTPTVKITTPTKDQVVASDKASDFSVKLDVKNWQTAQGSNHVHLILDNKRQQIVRWIDTPYTFVKQQSDRNPLVWSSLAPPSGDASQMTAAHGQ